jgi:hypothetical protein
MAATNIGVFAQSIGRLYKAGRVTLEKVESLHSDGKLTDAEYEYVLSQKN